jgi:hypothetical protein
MCCFSRPVVSVSDTSIFARAATAGRQYLAYEMRLAAAEDLAMILPLPTAPGSGEAAVEFIDLSDYAGFFADLTSAFTPLTMSRGGFEPQAALAVVQVGSFEASFVPTARDFDRLDARFRLPTELWSKLPDYERFGFAVFKLKPGKHRVHPMAFTFPSARPEELFFPTVHVHDGRVHEHADFDHALFCQRAASGETVHVADWEHSADPARFHIRVPQSRGLIEPDRLLHRRRIKGRAPNRDVWLPL